MKITRRLSALLLLTLVPFTGALAQRTNTTTTSSTSNSFTWKNLDSDIAGVGRHVDSNSINPWGTIITKNATLWVNNNGSGTTSIYNLDGSASTPASIIIPKSASNSGGANPTGIDANSGTDFKITKGTSTQPATVLFATEDGTISGFNTAVDPANAILAVDNGASGAVYKGLAVGLATTTVPHSFVYVTNFHSGKVEMYNETFQRADTSTTFTDPNLPAGFAPFGIKVKNGQVFVTYAKQDASQHDDVPGAGNGFINIFDQAGTFVKRLVSNGNLNSPWGLAFIATQFGRFKNGLYVGNFGDGQINVYDPAAGTFTGALRMSDGTPLVFDGLWALTPGNAGLYFTAGIVDESHGLFGQIVKGSQ